MRIVKNFMNSVKSITEGCGALVRGEPCKKSRIDGLSISLEKKDGALLTRLDNPEIPAVENTYYEIRIDSNGENPEYPQQTSRFYFTVAANDNMGSGYVNGVNFIPAKAQFTGFSLAEEFNNGSPPSMGKRMPPHHMATLRADFQTADGHKSYVALGFAVRKSERESPAWEAARRCPVTYI